MSVVVQTSPVNPGDILDDKYRVEKILGAGGMGVVVVATHLHLDQRVAIKFLLPSVSKNAEAVARFAREARAAARISSEHVARVIDVAKMKDGAPYIVMEYLEGHDLEQMLETKQALPVEKVVDYILQALEALAEAHAAGIVHRDLKPANLFLARRADGSSVVKVLDFGISKLVRGDKDAAITTGSVQMGSPLYMSPEQLRSSRDVDMRSDIWAIGVILHELITATPPFGGDTLPEVIASILAEPPLSLRLRRPEAPRELEQVVLRCLQKDPAERFPDVAQLAVALAPFGPPRSALSVERVVRVIAGRKEVSMSPEVAGVPEPAPPSVKEPQTNPSWQTSGVLRSARHGRRLVVAAIAGVVLVGGVAAAIVLTRGSPATPPLAAATALTAPPAAAPMLPPAPSSTPDVTAMTTATAPAAAPPATATATSTATVVPNGARPTGGRPTSSGATATATAPHPAPAAPAAALPDKPGPADFGGRK
ncbi:MAG: serine/threonine-protein kinase [Polyangiaceae bacterium]